MGKGLTIFTSNLARATKPIIYAPISSKLGEVIPSGLEPETYCLEGSCSIQLSYGTNLLGSYRICAA